MSKLTEIFPPLSERELKGAAISKAAAEEGMVLLKNDHQALPLDKTQPVALFGNGAVRTVRGGTGSGDPFNGGISGGGDADVDLSPRYHIHILSAMQDAGFRVVNDAYLNEIAEGYDRTKAAFAASPMDVFSYPEAALSEDDVRLASARASKAVMVISRNCGEGNDRKEEGNYRLTDIELQNLKLLKDHFEALIIVLNVPGQMCAKDLLSCDPDAILLMGQGGQEGGAALADILSGDSVPSGHLTDTWAYEYKDYPGADKYLSDWNTSKYEEGIYVGYRYFDTFNIDAAWHFGFGLSYTTFEMTDAEASMHGTDLTVSAKIRNTGSMAGKSVLQVYISAPETELEMPYQELKGFEKTGMIKPGEEETLKVVIPLETMASYSQKHGGYILSSGDYIVRAGDSSDHTVEVAAVRISETVVTKKVYEELPLVEELHELSKNENCRRASDSEELPVLYAEELPAVRDCRSVYHDGSVTTYTTDPSYKAVLPYEKSVLVEKHDWKYEDLVNGKVSVEEFFAQFTAEELANFVCGTGWGIEDDANPVVGASSESVPGAAGETTHQLEKKYGIPSVVVADGPGGVRLTQHFFATNTETGKKQEVLHHCIAWPVGSVIARSFDRKVLREVGRGMSADLNAFRIGVLLGPGINIQKNPLCGRNFEYFSEDPFLAGEMAAAIVGGVQEDGTTGACIKHFAANNQETNRNANDSVVGERALREIYLEPFRIAVEKSAPWSIMTSYNKINSVPASDSRDLCLDMTRGEWGYEGMIMTDWNGGSSTPSISMHAGNDLIMPGGKMREMNILQAVQDMAPAFDERGEVEKIGLMPGLALYSLSWFDFTPCKDGKDRVTAQLGGGHKAEIRDGLILVDNEPVYTEAGTFGDLIRGGRENFRPLKTPLTEEMAEISEDGSAIIYHGTKHFDQTICLGDIQERAKYVLGLIRTVMEKRK